MGTLVFVLTLITWLCFLESNGARNEVMILYGQYRTLDRMPVSSAPYQKKLRYLRAKARWYKAGCFFGSLAFVACVFWLL